MKLKVYVIDFETPRWLRKLVAYAVPALMVSGVGVAMALPVDFTAKGGQALKAADLASNFTSLDARVGTLEQAPTVLESASDTDLAGAMSTNTLYTPVSLTLTPGTWLVQAFATLSSTMNSDQKALGLYNETAGADVPNSRSGIGTATMGDSESYTTSKVIVVVADTVIRMKAFRQGASIVNFGSAAVMTGGRQRMLAVKLN
jgi:hypothetical protein